MPRFVFKLESVLRLRVHAEQKRQRELAEAQRRITELQGELDAVEREVGEATAQLRDKLAAARIDPRWLLLHAHHMQSLRARSSAISEEMFQAGLAVETAQEALVVACAERKSLEKLRQKQHEQHDLMQERGERVVLDEIAARGFLQD
ncbi:MAG TPA: flagellar export protein FliJ [Tepidisphaeraceae bacterium]|jgi:flagellar export protein FliJ